MFFKKCPKCSTGEMLLAEHLNTNKGSTYWKCTHCFKVYSEEKLNVIYLEMAKVFNTLIESVFVTGSIKVGVLQLKDKSYPVVKSKSGYKNLVNLLSCIFKDESVSDLVQDIDFDSLPDEDFIPLFAGRPDRTDPINEDDILNLKIWLATL